MKKLLALILAVLTLALLVSCTGSGDTPDVTTGGAATGTAATDPTDDLHVLVDSVKEFYGESTKFVFRGDETSPDDSLIFNYFVEEEDVLEAVSDYVLSVTDGMTADTFAVIKFKEGTARELIDKVDLDLKMKYMSTLKDSLSMYAPDEAAAVDTAVVRTTDTTCTLVISSAHMNEIMEKLK